MAASIGTYGKLGIAASGDPTSRFDYVDENLITSEDFLDTNGLRGTRSRSIERVRANLRRIGGPIRFQPTAAEWAILLPWLLGANASGNTYALAEQLQARDVTIDRIIKVFTYTGCKVDSFTISGSQGQPLELTVNVVGIDETVDDAGTFPSLDIDITTQPFIFIDLVLSINSVTVNAREFSLTVNHMIDKERFFNSPTLTAVNATDRQIDVSTTLPAGDHFALYNTGAAGVATTATFTNGGTSLVWTMPKVTFPRKTPNTPGRQEIMLPLQGKAYKSGTTSELTVTLDSTP